MYRQIEEEIKRIEKDAIRKIIKAVKSVKFRTHLKSTRLPTNSWWRQYVHYQTKNLKN
jgi:hypothetical protein